VGGLITIYSFCLQIELNVMATAWGRHPFMGGEDGLGGGPVLPCSFVPGYRLIMLLGS
jgi:hypothetical protein